jgi:hypothetical protein
MDFLEGGGSGETRDKQGPGLAHSKEELGDREISSRKYARVRKDTCCSRLVRQEKITLYR